MNPKKIKIFNFKLWNITIVAYLIVVILYALLSLTEIGREVEYTYNFNKWLLENFKFITLTLAWFYYGYTEKDRFKEEINPYKKREVYRLEEGGIYKKVKFKDLKKGNIFKMYEPDGKLVKDDDGSFIFKCDADAYVSDYGVAIVSVEEVNND